MPVNEVEFIYHGGIYAENRRCQRLPDGPVAGQPFVIGYGPKLLATANLDADTPAWPTTLDALGKQGIEPLGPELRLENFRFVFGAD